MLVGIALGILVVEAAYRSGTSVTAKLAKEQKRKVFVLPHEIGNKYGVGTNRLIKNGATLVCSTKEIIEEFDFLEYKNLNKKVEKEVECNLINIKNKEQREIYKIIFNGANTVTDIYAKSNKSINEINNILLMLEIEGNIEKVAGGYKCV